MDLRAIQKPLKDRYRAEPDDARITLRADGRQTNTAMTCSVDVGRGIQAAQAHTGVGGPGTAACSGDLLLGALAACAQITGQMVAAATGVPLTGLHVVAEGDLDLRGTLGLSSDVRVGFSAIRLTFHIDAPDASPEQIESLRERTERYCVVYQTLVNPPLVDVQWDTE